MGAAPVVHEWPPSDGENGVSAAGTHTWPGSRRYRRTLAKTIIELDQERFTMKVFNGVDWLRRDSSALGHRILFEALHSSFDAAGHIVFEV
jgi:hypothetical protein